MRLGRAWGWVGFGIEHDMRLSRIRRRNASKCPNTWHYSANCSLHTMWWKNLATCFVVGKGLLYFSAAHIWLSLLKSRTKSLSSSSSSSSSWQSSQVVTHLVSLFRLYFISIFTLGIHFETSILKKTQMLALDESETVVETDEYWLKVVHAVSGAVATTQYPPAEDESPW